MNYLRQIEAAMAQAAPLEWSDGEWVPKLTEDTATHYFPVEGEHNFPMSYPSRDGLERPYNILVATPSEVASVMRDYATHTGYPINESVVNSKIVHEGEHMDVVRQQGGQVLYELKFLVYEGATAWTLATAPVDWRTTKIGYALTSVYPRVPSAGDLYNIRSIGYKSVGEVRMVAAAHGLPAPLWS